MENQSNSAGITTLEVENFRSFPAFYSVTLTDDFDSSTPISLMFRIPFDAVAIQSVTLNLFFLQYRGFSTSNGFEAAHTHDIGHVHFYDHEHNADGTHTHSLASRGHFHIVTGATTDTNTILGLGITSSDAISGPTDSNSGTSGLQLFYGTSDYQPNTFSGSAHTHPVNYGVTSDTYPHNVTLSIDGNMLPLNYNPDTVPADRIIIGNNITNYVINNSINNGVHSLIINSSQNGRVVAEIYIKCIIRNG
jgi:hypothetical protein